MISENPSCRCADGIAQTVLDSFDRLPEKFKPRRYPDGSREWTTLCGIVLSGNNSDYECVALGTGVRCLPSCKLPLAQGQCLHDWHAEVVALRAFNHFVLEECIMLCKDETFNSDWICRSIQSHDILHQQPFAFRTGVQIDLYCSEAPCGDASMELVMNAQVDPTPWNSSATSQEGLAGRGHFLQLGVVRRKPGRGDAPETASKSCSDKLAMKQCTSVLSSLTSLFVCPGNAYLRYLVLPSSRYVQVSIERCFSRSGRLSELRIRDAVSDYSLDDYAFHALEVLTTNTDFSFSKPASDKGKSSSSNITAVFTPQKSEVLIGGSLQGFKQFSERGSSFLSRKNMWMTSLELARIGEMPHCINVLQSSQYKAIKLSSFLETRRKVKEEVIATSLNGWISNNGDGEWGLSAEA